MVTYIVYNICETVHESGQKSITTIIQYDGNETPLTLNFKDTENLNIPSQDVFVITGDFKEELKPFRISLNNVYFDAMPSGENWETFLVDYFISQKSRIRISTWNDTNISLTENQIYIECSISKDKKTLKKLEFGRYLPIEKQEYIRKSTSWTKGVFINDNDLKIKFLQTSWYGEDGEQYSIVHNKQNEKIILKVLKIPFEIGWTEEDTTVGEENYYKAKASIIINGKQEQWSYNLLDIGQQDIPMITDAPARWLTRLYYDGFWCNSNRRIDKTIVLPINHNERKNNC
ncbi:MAG TPA: hypothetical protein VF868_00045 [Bacteroidia bacterium]|jgi:hypothetical protein